MQVSQLNSYSIGVAAENKSLTDRILMVTPVEVLNALDGEINFQPTDTIYAGKDVDGSRYEVKVTEDTTLTCEWLPMDPNRVTPPNIRRGELVEVLRMADTDQYYWRCLGLRNDLRRLETVVWAISASPDNRDGNGINLDTCYYLEFSSHKKLITLGTSQANGEPYGYTLQLNTGDGQFDFVDTLGNEFFLDSGEMFWEWKNAAESVIQLDKTNIYGKADDNIEFKAGKVIKWEAGDAIHMKAGSETTLESPTVKIDSTDVTVNASLTTLNTNITMVGSFYSSGVGNTDDQSFRLDGQLYVMGPMFVNGPLDAETITCRRIVSESYGNLP